MTRSTLSVSRAVADHKREFFAGFGVNEAPSVNIEFELETEREKGGTLCSGAARRLPLRKYVDPAPAVLSEVPVLGPTHCFLD